MHKNNNDASGNYGIYQIIVEGKVFKIGKADLDRITKISGDPTRIHQQVTKLRKKYMKNNVFHIILEELFGYTTQQAKEVERTILRFVIAQQGGIIPEGNQKSFKL